MQRDWNDDEGGAPDNFDDGLDYDVDVMSDAADAIAFDDYDEMGSPQGYIDVDGEPMAYWLPPGVSAAEIGVKP